MKGKRNLLIGIVLGALIGWTLSYLRLPNVEKNFSFFMGFIACLSIVSLGIILLFVWNKHSLLITLLSKYSSKKDSNKATRTYTLIWILVSVFIVLGGLLSSFLIFNQNKLFKTQTQTQNKRIQEQSELIESIRKSNLVFLMSNILDKVDDELKHNPKGMLSDATIARIAALSYSFKPYRYLEGDSLSKKKFSPERGQLLLALSIINIDSSSFIKVKLKTPFLNADLRNANLRMADLSKADLRGANLWGADLRKANLREADLRGANLWGANLKGANLSGSDLKRADFSWANMNGANLSEADIYGANMISAKLEKADLRQAGLRWADLSGVFLNEANMAGIDLAATGLRRAIIRNANLSDADLRYIDLSQTDLSGSDLSGSDLKFINLSEADLTGVELNGAVVEEDWFQKLNEWQTIGAKEIQSNYKIFKDTSTQTIYKLEKIEDLN